MEEMESNGTRWLADSLQAVDNNVKQLLKLIEDKNIRISNDDSETEDQKRSQIATCMNDLRSKYHLLAERYSLLAKERGDDFHEFDENPSSPFYTPASKLPKLPALGSDVRLTDLSYNNGFGSSSNSLSDSASENSNSELLTNDGVLDGEERVVQNGLEKILINRIEERETEVQIVNAKVKSSEEEASIFKSKFEGNEAVVKQLKDEIEASRALAEKKDEVIGSEKSKVSELEEMILSNADAISKCSEEVQRLKEALADAHNTILQKDEHHQSEVSTLLEQKKSIESLFNDHRQQIESFEKALSALKMELAEARSSHDAKEENLKAEMKSLEEEKTAKSDTVETLSKCADALKHKCDMANAKVETLGAELSHKDNVIHQLNERINRLNSVNADLNVSISNLRVNQNAVRQLEVRATQSQMALCKAISESDSLNKCIDELRVRVNELEVKLEEQRGLVAEGAELKREAIRQLCICLEHYRTEYLELREVMVGKKRRTRTDLDSHGTSSS